MPQVDCPCGSGKPFDLCHGAVKPAPEPVVVQATPKLLKLDLACGQNVREGFEGVDIWEGSRYVVDLWKFPWPFEDNSCEALYSSHYIEHIPMEFVEHRGKKKDALFAFFDECFRILIDGGVLTIITPNARSNRAFQDPTHRRFIVQETFLYPNKEWRQRNKLDHYHVDCDFDFSVLPIISKETSLLSNEEQARKFNSEWNSVYDWSATLTARKKR